MIVIELALYIVAFILLVLAAGDWAMAGRWNLGWLGLAAFVLGVTLPRLLPML